MDNKLGDTGGEPRSRNDSPGIQSGQVEATDSQRRSAVGSMCLPIGAQPLGGPRNSDQVIQMLSDVGDGESAGGLLTSGDFHVRTIVDIFRTQATTERFVLLLCKVW